MELSLPSLRAALPKGGLFGGGAWRWSPEPFRLNRKEADAMTRLGHSLARFQLACDTLYRRSSTGNIHPWLADWLDRGKPEWLIQHQRSRATADHMPRVIRPDLLLTGSGFGLTELDSVPGGIGVTAWLSQTYSSAGFDIIGGANGMIEGFRSLLPKGGNILVSKESADYRPEMEWLAGTLGANWNVADAESWQDDGRDIYRFFELFDWQSIPGIRAMADGAAQGSFRVTPPFKPHLEEKMWLALLWSPSLRTTWKISLRDNHLQKLRELTPHGWVMDPTPLPPHAALPGLDVHSWGDVAAFSQKERKLVLKVSGFHETAWGSRGVSIGHDMASTEWEQQIHHALGQAETHPWILQEFREGRIVEHPVFRDDGSVETLRGRVRLCPYFFTDTEGETRFGGCLATIVPADKKKIHGMSDGVLVPCTVEPS